MVGMTALEAALTKIGPNDTGRLSHLMRGTASSNPNPSLLPAAPPSEATHFLPEQGKGLP